MLLKYLKQFDDISCYTYPFPTGRVYIFGNSDSLKLVIFGHGVNHKKDIEKKYKKSVTEEMEKAVAFLDRYLIGENGILPKLDISLFGEKEKKVYDELLKVKFGKTISYKKLSEKAGINNGARFVGNTMAKNPFPIFIPCHRVVNSTGRIGNFSAGVATKKFLLQHESALLNSK